MKDRIFEFIKSRDLINIHKLEKKIGCSGGCVDKFMRGNRGLSDRWVKPLEDILKDYGYSITNDFSISETKPKPLTKEKPNIVSGIAPKKDVKIEKKTMPDKSFESEVKTNLVSDEYPMVKSPKLKLRRTAQQWVELRRECTSKDEYAEWLKDLEEDEYLTTREKQLIKETK